MCDDLVVIATIIYNSIVLHCNVGLYYCIDSCGSSRPVWPWILGIVVGIIVIGVMALIIWKCIIYWKVVFYYSSELVNSIFVLLF